MKLNQEQISSITDQYNRWKMRHDRMVLFFKIGNELQLFRDDAASIARRFGLPLQRSADITDPEGKGWTMVSLSTTNAKDAESIQEIIERLHDEMIPFEILKPVVADAAAKQEKTEVNESVIFTYDKAGMYMTAALPGKKVAARIRQDRSVDWSDGILLSDEHRRQIERFATAGNRVVNEGKELALAPLNPPGVVYDNPHRDWMRQNLSVEKVDGEDYAVNGRMVIAVGDEARALVPDSRAVQAEFRERAERYVRAASFRLYQACFEKRPAGETSKAEVALVNALRYREQDMWERDRINATLQSIRKMAAQDSWMIHGRELPQSRFLVYVRDNETQKFRPLNLESGEWVDRIDKATALQKSDVETVVNQLRQSLEQGNLFQVRDPKGKVMIDSTYDLHHCMVLSEAFDCRSSSDLVFAADTEKGGILVAIKGQETGVHIHPDRSIESTGSYRFTAADWDCIEDFAANRNILVNGDGKECLALLPVNEPSKIYDCPEKNQFFPVSIENVEGVDYAAHGLQIVASGHETARFIDNTPENMTSLRTRLEQLVQLRQHELVRATLGGDDSQLRQAEQNYRDAEQYRFQERFNPEDTDRRIALVREVATQTLSILMKRSPEQLQQTGQSEATGKEAGTREAGEEVREQKMVGNIGGTDEKMTSPTSLAGFPPLIDNPELTRPEAALQDGRDGTSVAEGTPARSGTPEQTGQTGQTEGIKDGVSIFKLDDGRYGINETKGGQRSITRRLSEEDARIFFEGIKELSPEEQSRRRMALAEKYIHQGFVPPSAKPVVSVPALPELDPAYRDRIDNARIFPMRDSRNYAVRAVIDGIQMTSRLIRKADLNAFFYNKDSLTKEEKSERLMQLAALYYKEELSCERLDFEQGLHR